MTDTSEAQKLHREHQLQQIKLAATVGIAVASIGYLLTPAETQQPGKWFKQMLAILALGYLASKRTAQKYIRSARTIEIGQASAATLPIADPPINLSQTIRSYMWAPATLAAALNAGTDETQARKTVIAGLVGRSNKEILNAARETVTQSAAKANNRCRIITDSNPCAWCAMLASQGPVYRSTTTGRANLYHDYCGCLVAEYHGDPRNWKPTEQEQKYLDAYHEAHRATGSYDPKTLTNAMRSNPDNADLFHDAIAGSATKNTTGSAVGAALEKLIQEAIPGVTTFGFEDVGDVTLAQARIEALQELLPKYPDHGIVAVGFEDRPDKPGVVASVSPLANGGSRLSINPGSTFDQERAEHRFRSGYMRAEPGTDGTKFVITHEIAHALTNAQGRAVLEAQARQILIDAELAEIEAERMASGTSTDPATTAEIRAALADMTDKHLRARAFARGKVSRYSGVNGPTIRETIAEAFATVEMSPATASEVERAIHDLLK
ncbi:MAG: hypothetical protein LBR20_02240 [Propionibacteriaceae bacterium]|jgi:hypothetical protein|nr:hypothetical protein [Propionibacteriaceae bacterium]